MFLATMSRRRSKYIKIYFISHRSRLALGWQQIPTYHNNYYANQELGLVQYTHTHPKYAQNIKIHEGQNLYKCMFSIKVHLGFLEWKMVNIDFNMNRYVVGPHTHFLFMTDFSWVYRCHGYLLTKNLFMIHMFSLHRNNIEWCDFSLVFSI